MPESSWHHLWNEARNTFANRAGSGTFSHRITPTSFYPLLCAAATSEQARQLVAAHLEDPHGFLGDFMLPSIRRDDPAYRDQDYWRGRIWRTSIGVSSFDAMSS